MIFSSSNIVELEKIYMGLGALLEFTPITLKAPAPSPAHFIPTSIIIPPEVTINAFGDDYTHVV